MEQHPASAAGRGYGMTDWRPFLRGFAEEVDSLAAPGERDDMLRGIGRRIARMVPLAPVQSLAALEIEMNDALGSVGWGEVRLAVMEPERMLRLSHAGMPRIGSLGTPPGHWLSALLEGLYDGWLSQQPGANAVLSTRREHGGPDGAVTMMYGRHY